MSSPRGCSKGREVFVINHDDPVLTLFVARLDLLLTLLALFLALITKDFAQETIANFFLILSDPVFYLYISCLLLIVLVKFSRCGFGSAPATALVSTFAIASVTLACTISPIQGVCFLTGFAGELLALAAYLGPLDLAFAFRDLTCKSVTSKASEAASLLSVRCYHSLYSLIAISLSALWRSDNTCLGLGLCLSLLLLLLLFEVLCDCLFHLFKISLIL